ncbi:MAG: hypothetical protein JWO78_1365 [Micavibrio sp.]|nr:hypothetical protein [Micavibrio sp.]
MMKNSRNSLLTLFILACLSGVATIVLVCCSERTAEKPLTGVDLFVKSCGTQGKPNQNCLSREAVENVFGFDLMAEIDGRYQKMKKTAHDIAAGTLTDDGYRACLKEGSCAEVPMLDEKLGDKTPRAKEISRTFWELADGHYLSLGICKTMPVCAVALENGILVAKKNRVVAAKAGKS